MVEDDPLISADEAARACRQQPGTLATWRCKGKGPHFVKIGRLVFYRESQLRAWLKAQERDPAAKARVA
jgi:hypothetical protein